jgi:hypothetical protein
MLRGFLSVLFQNVFDGFVQYFIMTLVELNREMLEALQ